LEARRLATVEGDPAKQGKLSVLASVPMKNGIAENVALWTNSCLWGVGWVGAWTAPPDF
jgi:hypothetical protein